jgi:hypothetical protein
MKLFKDDITEYKELFYTRDIYNLKCISVIYNKDGNNYHIKPFKCLDGISHKTLITESKKDKKDKLILMKDFIIDILNVSDICDLKQCKEILESYDKTKELGVHDNIEFYSLKDIK